MAAKYERLKIIGRGTFGLAWLTRSRSSQRPYVVKEIRLVGMTEKDRNQAVNEVAILAGLKHANVVRYREAFVEDAMLHIAMEYADGGDLGETIQANRQAGQHFSEDRIMDWFVQICFALRYIHAKKILHRDLKPPNIFVTTEGIIKVGDFGIARMLHDTRDHAHTAIGTPYYMSPEICRRKPYNQKSDMWAAGCVLYEMTSLVHPFEATDFSSLVMKIMRGRYKAIPRHYGPLVEDLVSVLLRVDPERRPSADQLLSIPGIHGHVLAFTDRCKNWCSSPVTTVMGGSQSWRCKEGHGSMSRVSATNGLRVDRVKQDSSIMTTRRHSVASVTGSERVGGAPTCSQSADKQRRQSVGVRVSDCEPARNETIEKMHIGKRNMACPKERCTKLVMNTYRQHRVASTSIIPDKIGSQTGNSEDSTAGESTCFAAWKQRRFSVDIADKTDPEKSDRATNSAGDNSTASPSSSTKGSVRKECTSRQRIQYSMGCAGDLQLKSPILDLFDVERNGKKAVTKRSLKKSTYVLESPSSTVFGSKARHIGCAITKDTLQVQEMSDGTPKRTSGLGNRCHDVDAVVVGGASDSSKPLGGVHQSRDSFGHWMDSCLQHTVIERRKTPAEDELSDYKANCVRESSYGDTVCEANVTQQRDGDISGSSDINECLLKSRIKAGDSAREVRGKIETLRIYLEEKIGVESSLACLDLIKSGAGQTVHSVLPDRIVLGKLEGVLGKDGLPFVPVALHLHNLEQSCDWLAE